MPDVPILDFVNVTFYTKWVANVLRYGKVFLCYFLYSRITDTYIYNFYVVFAYIIACEYKMTAFVLFFHAKNCTTKFLWGLILLLYSKHVQTVHIDYFKEEAFSRNSHLILVIDRSQAILGNACMTKFNGTSYSCKRANSFFP